jgi:hypothetical protein
MAQIHVKFYKEFLVFITSNTVDLSTIINLLKLEVDFFGDFLCNSLKPSSYTHPMAFIHQFVSWPRAGLMTHGTTMPMAGLVWFVIH